MTLTRTLFLFFAIATGCSRDSQQTPPVDLGSGELDLAVPADLLRPDLATADLAAKRGWTQVFASSGLRLNSVWGSSAGDVYAVGLQGTIFHSSGDDVWSQQKMGRKFELTSVSGSSAKDVYAVESESVLHSTGDGVWSVVSGIQNESAASFRQVFLTSPNSVYVAGSTSKAVPAYPTGGINILRWADRTATREYARAEHAIGGLFGSGSTDLWAVGSYQQGGGTLGMVLHSTGDGVWSQQNFEPDKGILYLGTLSSVWASSKSDVYTAAGFQFVGGSGGIFRCAGRGTDWRRETDPKNPPFIYALWGSGPADVWAVGFVKDGPNYNGLVLRSKGDGQWAPDPDLPAAKLVGLPLSGIWGSRYGDVYIVGQSGVILHKRE